MQFLKIIDDDWGSEDDKPAQTYEEAEVIMDWYPESSKDFTLLKYFIPLYCLYVFIWIKFCRYDTVYIFKKEPGEWWYGEHKGNIIYDQKSRF